MHIDYLILGGGIAALTAAQELRRADSAARIVMLSDEEVLCYSRPMLSKASFKGFALDRILVHPPEWYRERSIEVLYDAVRSIDPAAHRVQGRETVYSYRKLIYALGASANRPQVGQEATVLRSYRDFWSIKERLPLVQSIAVVGGGVIGIEAALELARLGKQVAVYEIGEHLMPRLLDRETADILAEKLLSLGIAVHFGPLGQSYDLVLLSCGIHPNTEIAQAAGLPCDRRGVVVDAYMRTGAPDLYACGDCASFEGQNLGLWSQAMAEAAVAASTATGGDARYAGVDDSVILSTPEFGLFVKGDLQHGEAVYAEPALSGTFRVNPAAGETYEKRLYQNGVLTGAALIGHLGRMKTLRKEMEEQRVSK